MALEQSISILRSMGPLVFDAVFEERHESELEVTDNPVETGVIVSDHAFMKPERLTIRAGVSDTPLRVQANDPYSAGVARSREAFRLLQELQAKAEPFDVQTGLKLYRNMLVIALRTGQDVTTANALLFEAELREILIVSTEAVTYPPRKAGPTKQQASKKQNKGEQQAADVDNKQTNKSIVKALKDLLTGQ